MGIMIKNKIIPILILGVFSLSFATESRIDCMGKNDRFFLDDMSIFRNPANVGILSGYLTGSLGRVQSGEPDPLRPWFGGVLVFPISKDHKVFYGGAFNRFDPILDEISTIRDYRIPGTLHQRVVYHDNLADAAGSTLVDADYDDTTSVLLPTLRSRLEGIIGYSFKGMFNVGFHFYRAGEDSSYYEPLRNIGQATLDSIDNYTDKLRAKTMSRSDSLGHSTRKS